MEANRSQRYLSTRGGSQTLGFEEVVLKGLATDGGLFIPEEIPKIPEDWSTKWKGLAFADLAFEILSLYISAKEVPANDLRDILKRSYATFRHLDVTPITTLDESQNLHLLELFHGPTFAFKDVALQFLGNLFEYFLVRRNEGKSGSDRYHLTVIGATSGDTGSAAIYGLRGKQDVSVFITFPYGRVSKVQEAQMTTVLDPNVHCIAIQGSDSNPATFDDCQDLVKAMFADAELNSAHHLAAINSINWARILAQITYFFHAYFAVTGLSTWKEDSKLRFVVPSGNFGDVLAGFFAKRMGLPISKLVVATNENDILHRFFNTGRYEKRENPTPSDTTLGLEADGVKAQPAGALETLTPAMDIVVSSNFERLLYILQLELTAGGSYPGASAHQSTAQQVEQWLSLLKSKGGFAVSPAMHASAVTDFESEKVTDPETVATIKTFFAPRIPNMSSYVLDPHSAVGIHASLKSIARDGPPRTHTVSLATAHPAKFASAVDQALGGVEGFDFEKQVLPDEFVGMEEKEKRVRVAQKGEGVEGMRQLIREELQQEAQ